MAYKGQTLEGLEIARFEASDLLIDTTSLGRALKLEEAYAFQGASHLSALNRKDGSFYGMGIAEFTPVSVGFVSNFLNRFVDFEVLEFAGVRPRNNSRGNPPKFYTPSELGVRVFEIFQDGLVD